jgi:hypothetical protein
VALQLAKWDVTPPVASQGITLRGIVVEVNAAGVVPDDVKRAGEAGSALVEHLKKGRIEANRHGTAGPLGLVLIRIGKKSNPIVVRMIREWKKQHGFSD